MTKTLYLTKANLSREGREAMAEWLNQTHWDIFTTITFADERRSILGITHSYYSFLNHLYDWWNIYPVKSFFALERHKYRAIPHIHSLIKFGKDTTEFVKELPISKNAVIRFHLNFDKDFSIDNVNWSDIWQWTYERFGRTRIEKYDINRGAGYYLTKYIYKPDGVVWWNYITDTDWKWIRQGYQDFKLSLDKKKFTR